MESKKRCDPSRDGTGKRITRDEKSSSTAEDSRKKKRLRKDEAFMQQDPQDVAKTAPGNELAENVEGSLNPLQSISRTDDASGQEDKSSHKLDTTATDAARVASLLEEDLLLESANAFFPEKIMALLDSGDESEAMWWQPQGDSFCIVQAKFDHVLNKHFQGTKFESFTRKLNRWGFRRAMGQQTPPGAVAYFHHDFLRGRPELVKEIGGSKRRVQANHERRRNDMIMELKMPDEWTDVTMQPQPRLLDIQTEQQLRATLANASQVTRELLLSADRDAIQTTLSRNLQQGLAPEAALQLSTGYPSDLLRSEATRAALDYSLGSRVASLGATYADTMVPRRSNNLNSLLNPLLPASIQPPNEQMGYSDEVIGPSLAQYLEEARRMEQINAAIRLNESRLQSFSSDLPDSFPRMTYTTSLPEQRQTSSFAESLPQGQLGIGTMSPRFPLPITMPGVRNDPIPALPRLERSEIPRSELPPPTNTSITPIDIDRIIEQYLQQQQANRKDGTGQRGN